MNVLDLGGAYKGLIIMALFPSDQQLECEFQVLTNLIEESMLDWQKYNRILTLTGIKIENIFDLPRVTGNPVYDWANRDYNLQLGIARICYLRMQELTRTIERVRRSIPRFISYDEETRKHVWEREYLYPT